MARKKVDWNAVLEKQLRELLTEENSDAMIDALLARVKLPFWLKGSARSVLDQILPEVLLDVIMEQVRSKEPTKVSGTGSGSR